MSELDGFVVMERKEKQTRNEISIRVDRDACRFSMLTVKYLDEPKYLNIFFDAIKKRMLCVVGEVEYPNTFTLSPTSAGLPGSVVNSKELVEQIRLISGVQEYCTFLGHMVEGGNDKVIFDLDHPINLRKKGTNGYGKVSK